MASTSGKRSRLPGPIEIRYLLLAVVEDDASLSSKDDGALELEESRIVVSSKLRGVALANAVRHELNHVPWALGELRKDSSEEDVVIVLTNLEVELFLRNPRFVEWYRRTLADR